MDRYYVTKSVAKERSNVCPDMMTFSISTIINASRNLVKKLKEKGFRIEGPVFNIYDAEGKPIRVSRNIQGTWYASKDYQINANKLCRIEHGLSLNSNLGTTNSPNFIPPDEVSNVSKEKFSLKELPRHILLDLEDTYSAMCNSVIDFFYKHGISVTLPSPYDRSFSLSKIELSFDKRILKDANPVEDVRIRENIIALTDSYDLKTKTGSIKGGNKEEPVFRILSSFDSFEKGKTLIKGKLADRKSEFKIYVKDTFSSATHDLLRVELVCHMDNNQWALKRSFQDEGQLKQVLNKLIDEATKLAIGILYAPYPTLSEEEKRRRIWKILDAHRMNLNTKNTYAYMSLYHATISSRGIVRVYSQDLAYNVQNLLLSIAKEKVPLYKDTGNGLYAFNRSLLGFRTLEGEPFNMDTADTVDIGTADTEVENTFNEVNNEEIER